MSNYLMRTNEEAIDSSQQDTISQEGHTSALSSSRSRQPQLLQAAREAPEHYNEPEEEMFRLLQYNVCPPQIPNSNLPSRMLEYNTDPAVSMHLYSHPTPHHVLQAGVSHHPPGPSSSQGDPYDAYWQPSPNPHLYSYPRSRPPTAQWVQPPPPQQRHQTLPSQPQLVRNVQPRPGPRGSSIGYRPPREQSHSAPDLVPNYNSYSYPVPRSQSYPSQAHPSSAPAPQEEHVFGLGISTVESPPHTLHPQRPISGPEPDSEPHGSHSQPSLGGDSLHHERTASRSKEYHYPTQSLPREHLYTAQQPPPPPPFFVEQSQVPPWLQSQQRGYDYGFNASMYGSYSPPQQPFVQQSPPQQPEMHTSYGVSQRAPSSSSGPVPQLPPTAFYDAPRFYGMPPVRSRQSEPTPPGGYYWSVSTAPLTRRTESHNQHHRNLPQQPPDDHTYVPIQLCEPPLFNVVPPNPSALNADPAPRSRKKSKYTLEQDRLILELKHQGYGWGEIAHLAKCDKTLAARNRYQVLIGQQGGGNFVWSKEDIQELQSFLDEGERAKWAFLAEELTRRRGKTFTLEMCHYRICELFRDNPAQFGVLKSKSRQSGGGVPMIREEYHHNYTQPQLPNQDQEERDQPEFESPNPALDEEDSPSPPV